MAHRHHLLLGVLFAFACGGRFDDSTGNAGTGGAGTGGGGEQGGASNTGGAGGVAGASGAPTGGAAGAGASAGSGGAAAGGAAGSAGTGGEGGTSWTSCSPTTACVLEAVSCCGPGCEPVPLAAFTAINQASVAAYQKAHPACPCVALMCQTVAPEQRNVPSYMATCVEGQCKAIDIRTSALTVCTSSADCYLREGTSCCGDCNPDDLVAFSRTAAVQNALCPTGPTACPAIACAPLPDGVSAACEGGHCIVKHPHVVDASTTMQ
jgi:hypothetical protein